MKKTILWIWFGGFFDWNLPIFALKVFKKCLIPSQTPSNFSLAENTKVLPPTSPHNIKPKKTPCETKFEKKKRAHTHTHTYLFWASFGRDLWPRRNFQERHLCLCLTGSLLEFFGVPFIGRTFSGSKSVGFVEFPPQKKSRLLENISHLANPCIPIPFFVGECCKSSCWTRNFHHFPLVVSYIQTVSGWTLDIKYGDEETTLVTFHYTGWLIGILIIVYNNSHATGNWVVQSYCIRSLLFWVSGTRKALSE